MLQTTAATVLALTRFFLGESFHSGPGSRQNLNFSKKDLGAEVGGHFRILMFPLQKTLHNNGSTTPIPQGISLKVLSAGLRGIHSHPYLSTPEHSSLELL